MPIRTDRVLSVSAAATAVLLFQAVASGCICTRYRFVSVQSEDFRVVERSWMTAHYQWTIWPVPTRYEAARSTYRLEIRAAEYVQPYFTVGATDAKGNELDLRGPNQVARYGPRLPENAEEGSWSFDVIQDGAVIGSETIHYKIRSRPFACGPPSLP